MTWFFMTKESSRIVTRITSHRRLASVALLLLMVLPVVIFAEATRPEKGKIVILGAVYGMLGLALAAFLAWLYGQVEIGTRFMDLSADLSCIAGFDGYFKRLNSPWRSLLGFTHAELMSRPYLEFVHPDDRAVTVAEGQKLREREAAVFFENRCVCADGSYKWLAWRAISDPGEQLTYAVARDITAIKQASQPVAQQSAGQEASGRTRLKLQHDLRTPLNAIMGFSNLLADGVAGELNEKQKRFVGRIRTGATEITGIIDDGLAVDLDARPVEKLPPPEPGSGKNGAQASEETVVLYPAVREVQHTVETPVVLLVDDDPGALRLLEVTLQTAGYQTRTALNGKAALSILSVTPVHAVVVDLVMPEMDGFELIRFIRQDSGLKHLALLVMTSRYLSKDELTLLTHQTQALFQKGRFRGADLVAAVKGAMRERKAAGVAQPT